MTQQNAALVEETAAAASALRDQATELAGEVDRFKLPSKHWQTEACKEQQASVPQRTDRALCRGQHQGRLGLAAARTT